jgi:hypothetical protein
VFHAFLNWQNFLKLFKKAHFPILTVLFAKKKVFAAVGKDFFVIYRLIDHTGYTKSMNFILI